MSHPMNWSKASQQRSIIVRQMHACTSATTYRRAPSKAELHDMLAEAARNTAAIAVETEERTEEA